MWLSVVWSCLIPGATDRLDLPGGQKHTRKGREQWDFTVTSLDIDLLNSEHGFRLEPRSPRPLSLSPSI